jgi:hypothetical protein
LYFFSAASALALSEGVAPFATPIAPRGRPTAASCAAVSLCSRRNSLSYTTSPQVSQKKFTVRCNSLARMSVLSARRTASTSAKAAEKDLPLARPTARSIIASAAFSPSDVNALKMKIRPGML